MERQSLGEKTLLHQKYEIEKVLGNGGFGITYLSRDILLNQTVVVKEYFPWTLVKRDALQGELCPVFLEEKDAKKLYQKGKKDFLAEARRMSELFDVQAIVKILDFFEENDTAYLVMEYVRGISLEEYLERREIPFDFAQAWEKMEPVAEALEKVHKKGIIHRDLNPSNLMVMEDGSLKIIDFGAARTYLDHEKTMTILVKRGYAPVEQYSKKGKQGPWTDVYAVCATLYEMVTGVCPEPSINRQVKDELYLPSSYGTVITPEEESALARGLETDYRRRIRDMRELRDAMSHDGEKEEAEEKQKKIWVPISIGAVIAAAVLGIILWQFQKADQKTPVSYAGNYGRNTEEYTEFVRFTKEHATSQEVLKAKDEYELEREGAVLYTLPAEAVAEWGKPCNAFRFSIKKKEFLKDLEQSGYTIDMVKEEDKNTVEVQKYGAVLTRFTEIEYYKIKDRICIKAGYDSVNQDLIYLMLYTEKGNEDNLAEPGMDLLQILDTGMEETREEILQSFRENNTSYLSKLPEPEQWVYSYSTEECMIRWTGIEDGGYGYYFQPAAKGSVKYFWP